MKNPSIGICSWSLAPRSATDLVDKITALGHVPPPGAGPSAEVAVPNSGTHGAAPAPNPDGVDSDAWCVQLALEPIRTGAWALDDTMARLADAGIAVRSGMMAMHGEDYSTLETIRKTGGVRSDEHWERNLAAAKGNARIARALGLPLVTFHAGFMPDDRADPMRSKMLTRLRAIIDAFAAVGVHTAFETGQESADTLLDALGELDQDDVGVNFDPANMILYAMGDPVVALRKLAPRVYQIHIKDAVATTQPGTWGREVSAGAGDVDWPALFRVYREAGLDCDLIIERESGDARGDDVRRARRLVKSMIER